MDWIRYLLGVSTPNPSREAPSAVRYVTLHELVLENATKHAHTNCTRCAQWYPHLRALEKCMRNSSIAPTHERNMAQIYVERMQCIHQSATLAYLRCIRKRGVSPDLAKWMAHSYYRSLRAGRMTLRQWDGYGDGLHAVTKLVSELPAHWNELDLRWYRSGPQLAEWAQQLKAVKQRIFAEDHAALPRVSMQTLNSLVEVLYEMYGTVIKSDRIAYVRIAKALVDMILVLFPPNQIERDPALKQICATVTQLMAEKQSAVF